MFKAKLIEDSSYYQWKRKELLLVLLPALPAAILVNYMGFPVWVLILTLIVYISALLLLRKNKNKIHNATSKKMIEVNEKEISIRSLKNQASIIINPKDTDKIILNKNYGMPQESIADIAREINGAPKKNFIII